MTNIKTEVCSDQELKDLFSDRTSAFLESLETECKGLNQGEVLTGTLSLMVGYLVAMSGVNVAEAYLQQLIDLHKAHSRPLN